MTEMLNDLGHSPKLSSEGTILHMLHEEGRRAASAFHDAPAASLGHRSTADPDLLLSER